jgi:sensor c-di-GMP phosphodiesterase-like protein
MPLDKIKIDASFVSGLGQTHDLLKEKMIDIILAFARTMNIAVTAEGVETEVQMLALVKAGCHRAQGWHYSRALALDEALCLTNPIESASTHSEDD